MWGKENDEVGTKKRIKNYMEAPYGSAPNLVLFIHLSRFPGGN